MGTNTNNTAATENTQVEKELGPRAKFRLEPVIMVATTNPKKNPSESYNRFQGYFDIDWKQPQTVGSILDGKVVRMDDIRNDANKGYIVVGAEAIKAHEKQAEKQRKLDIEAARKLLAQVDG